MTTQEITLNQSSDADLYTKLLRGRYVTSINNDSITLDNGLILTIKGNEGCMACLNGWYHLERIYKQGSSRARIMSAHVEYSEDDNYTEGAEIYTIFVMVDGNPTQLPLAIVRGATTGQVATAQASPSPPPSNPYLTSGAVKASSISSSTVTSCHKATISPCASPAP